MNKIIVSFVVFLLATVTVSIAGDLRREPAGIVVEKVIPGSKAERAGIRPGDVLTRWRRLPNPPHAPGSAAGIFRSALEMNWLQMEEAPLGPIVFEGLRDGQPIEFEPIVHMTSVIFVEPLMSGEVRLAYQRVVDYADDPASDRSKEGVTRWVDLWEEAAELAARKGEYWVADWMYYQAGGFRGINGDHKDADTAFQSALQQVQTECSQASLLHLIGSHYHSLDQLDKADEAYASAIDFWKDKWSDGMGVARLLSHRGELDYFRGALEAAESKWKQSLAIQERLAPQGYSILQTLNYLAVLYYQRGEMATAEDLQREIVEKLQRLSPASEALATALGNLAVFLSAQSKLDEAESYHRQALQIKRKTGAKVDGTLNNLGEIARRRGDLKQAEARYTEALAELHNELEGETLNAAVKLSNLGVLASMRGRLEEAEDYHLRALKIRQKAIPGSPHVALTLNNLGTVAMERGDLDAAEHYLQQALQMIEKENPGSLDLAFKIGNLAEVASRRGEFKVAEDLHQKALAITMRLNPSSEDVALRLGEIGTLYLLRENPEKALDYYLQSLAIWDSVAPKSVELVAILNQASLAAMATGNEKAAKGYLDRALKIIEAVAPVSRDRAVLLNSYGQLYVEKDWRLAANYFSQALDTLEAQVALLGGTTSHQGSFRSRYLDLYRDAMDAHLKLHEADVKLHEVDAAFATLERARARSFLALLTERDVVLTADLPDELDQRRRTLAVQYGRAYEAFEEASFKGDDEAKDEAVSTMLDIRLQREEVAAEIRKASPRFAAIQYPEPLGTNASRDALDPGTLLLTFSVGKEGATLFSISKKHPLRYETLPTKSADVQHLTKAFRDAIASVENSKSTRAKTLRQLAHTLYETLLKPVEDRVGESERLLIVADGPLHTLPWGALLRRTRSGEEQFLVEWKPFHLVLSATVYAELLKERRGVDLSSPERVIAFGDPVYPGEEVDLARHQDVLLRSRAGERWPRLHHSQREVVSLVELFPGRVATYTRGAATEEEAIRITGDVDILHFGAHASVDERFPLSSYIVLTIPEDARDGKENGLLQAWEIFERLRFNADLVVLSACDTGTGPLQDGEGIIGLTRAFQYAGARSVLASLWKVRDDATAELMARFYRHLHAGKAKDQALRTAQLDMIRGPVELTTPDGLPEIRTDLAPFHWAAFQLYGDWQ